MNTTGRRTRSSRGQGEELRDEILDATERLLVETQSEEAVSIRSVARRVGVTAPSIYRHFEDKATLLFEVCNRHFDRLDREMAARRSVETDPVAAVMACGHAYIEFGLANPEAYRVMFMGHYEVTPEQYRDEVMADHGSFDTLVKAVQAVADAGRLKVDDVVTATLLLWTSVHGLVSLRVSKPNFPWPPLEEHVAATVAVLQEGLFLPA